MPQSCGGAPSQGNRNYCAIQYDWDLTTSKAASHNQIWTKLKEWRLAGGTVGQWKPKECATWKHSIRHNWDLTTSKQVLSQSGIMCVCVCARVCVCVCTSAWVSVCPGEWVKGGRVGMPYIPAYVCVRSMLIICPFVWWQKLPIRPFCQIHLLVLRRIATYSTVHIAT